jgi:hypothetical protein
VRYVSEQFSVSNSPEEILRGVGNAVAPLRRVTVRQAAPGQLAVVERSRPAWTIAIAILLFPIGLLALLATTESEIVISAYREGDETFVDVAGRGHKWLDKYLASLFVEDRDPMGDGLRQDAQ